MKEGNDKVGLVVTLFLLFCSFADPLLAADAAAAAGGESDAAVVPPITGQGTGESISNLITATGDRLPPDLFSVFFFFVVVVPFTFVLISVLFSASAVIPVFFVVVCQGRRKRDRDRVNESDC